MGEEESRIWKRKEEGRGVQDEEEEGRGLDCFLLTLVRFKIIFLASSKSC